VRAVVIVCLVLAGCGDGCQTTETIPERLDAYVFMDAPHCSTRITYASTWIKPAAHPTNVDTVDEKIEWDGTCVDDGANSYATLSNGWKPYFTGHAYYDGRYAVGVAKASSPLGPYTKYANNPILATSTDWIGPGHCTVVYGAATLNSATFDATDIYMVYHAWQAGHVNGAGDARMVLVDQIQWDPDGWPHIYGAPSSASRPAP